MINVYCCAAMQNGPTVDPVTHNAVYSHPIRECSLLGIGFPCSCRLCCCSQQDLLRKKEEKAERELFMKEAAEAAQAQLNTGGTPSLL